MAALTTIRSWGKVIAIAVGFALAAFVLGDLITSGTTIFGASQTKIGVINGNSVDYTEYQNNVENRENFLKFISQGNLDSEASEEVREYCWEQLIRKYTVGEFAEKQGIIVTDNEIVNLINTGNVTPMVRQSFSNPETGYYDPSYVSAFIASNTPESKYIWQNLESELRDMRQYVKYISMVNAGLYVTTADVEKEFAGRTQMSDVKYVAIPYSDIKDEEVKLSDKDIQQAYNTYKNRFERLQEAREISYVVFDVIASKSDSADALKISDDLKAALETASAENVENVINSKSDIPYYEYYYGKGDIQNDVVDSLMFAEKPGFVYGSYVEGQYYSVARLINTVMRPDSVKVQVLALAFNPADTLSVRNRIDSLNDVHKSGISFEALAAQYSQEQSSARDSGNIGWIVERSGLAPVLKNACFDTEKGKTTVVRFQNAYYLLKVADKTAPKQKALVGFGRVEIRPSNATRQAVYAKASEFAGLNRKPAEFQQAVVSNGLVPRVATVMAGSRQVTGLENSRELVRWAFDNDKTKEVSDVNEYGDRYVVAALAAVHKAGVPQISEIKNELTMYAMNSLKGDAIISKIGNVSSVDAVAAQMGKTAQEARNVNFEMSQIPGIGPDPAALAVAASLGQNQVSAPVKGNNAVYVFQNTSYTPAQAIQPINVETDKKMLLMDYRNRASYQIPQAINKIAKIQDSRAKFM